MRTAYLRTWTGCLALSTIIACGTGDTGNRRGDGDNTGADTSGGGGDTSGGGEDAGGGGEDTGAGADTGGGTDTGIPSGDLQEALSELGSTAQSMWGKTCVCMVSFGAYPTQEACETEFESQMGAGLDCSADALASNEAAGIDWADCMADLFRPADACLTGMDEARCMEIESCMPSDAAQDACDDLLTEEQQAAMDACDPEG